MNDFPGSVPVLVGAAMAGARVHGFDLSCDPRAGALLWTLAASKPGGRTLEIGTGLGVGSAWLLAGMDQAATLHTIEINPDHATAARRVLDHDKRCTVIIGDAAAWLRDHRQPLYDMAFVGSRIGKFEDRELLLERLAPGGLYVGDELLPQSIWPPDHRRDVERFRNEIVHEPGLVATLRDWTSGLAVAARTPHGA